MVSRLVSLVVYTEHDSISDGLVEKSANFELSNVSLLYRWAVRENIKFESHLFAGLTPEDKIQRVPVKINGAELGTSHTYKHSGIVAVAITANGYPDLATGRLLSEAIQLSLGGKAETHRASSVDELFSKFQKPEDADNICKIQHDLDEVQVLVQQSINDLLLRGETLDSLIEKSKDLSHQSKKFRKMAEKNTSCFVWIRGLFVQQPE